MAGLLIYNQMLMAAVGNWNYMATLFTLIMTVFFLNLHIYVLIENVDKTTWKFTIVIKKFNITNRKTPPICDRPVVIMEKVVKMSQSIRSKAGPFRTPKQAGRQKRFQYQQMADNTRETKRFG